MLEEANGLVEFADRFEGAAERELEAVVGRMGLDASTTGLDLEVLKCLELFVVLALEGRITLE